MRLVSPGPGSTQSFASWAIPAPSSCYLLCLIRARCPAQVQCTSSELRERSGARSVGISLVFASAAVKSLITGCRAPLVHGTGLLRLHVSPYGFYFLPYIRQCCPVASRTWLCILDTRWPQFRSPALLGVRPVVCAPGDQPSAFAL